MKMNRSYLFGTTVLAGVMAISAPALAQSTQPEEQVSQVEEIVVTGSRIRRDPTTSPTPLIQVQREQLLESGQSTMIDYLATIPALSNSVVPSDTTGSGLGDGGLSLANLRSLGSNRTLTLVDGRRHVGSNGGSLSVDVDTIPRLLIQNVEIVTGGASSVYGADAVSGVLNFVLRKDFEGVEIDANYARINEDGQSARRISALAGKNFFNDRLNVYGHAEYEVSDAVTSMDIDWLRRAPVIIGMDADPTSTDIGPNYDGILDNLLYTGVVRLDRPRWGSLTIANAQQPSASTNPNVPVANCTAVNSANCYSVDPAKTYWFDGGTARLANFGSRVGVVGNNRPYNIGGDGENPSMFSTDSRVPESESQRYQTGATFHLNDSVKAYAEAKYIKENTFDISQPTFFDVYLADGYTGSNETNYIIGTSAFILNWSDNAYLPSNIKDAIRANMVTNYANPTTTAPGAALAPVSRQWARHAMFGPDRSQDNDRELQRYVVGLTGDHDAFGPIKNLSWDIGYTYGQAKMQNTERGVDVLRFNLAADAVVDTAGVVNGKAGEIVCRAKLIQANGGFVEDWNVGGDLRDTPGGKAALDQCTPLNIFGAGNQSAEALKYVDASITVHELNRQHDAVASVSGQLWDMWGAGAIGVAVGAEYRKEYTEAVGRDQDTAGRWLFLNTGPDFEGASYESRELFGEISIPLFRDSFLGEYAELSGSYRYSDYSTIGGQDVYGVNFVYRPIRDIAFKTSFNTSIRVPNLGENFSPFTETFGNSFADPCATAIISRLVDQDIKSYRIANCTALAAQKGLTFDFAGTTADPDDDFVPGNPSTGVYASGVAGVSGGNTNLRPETSESFTFSVVWQPSFIPNFSTVLDYYEIRIEDVIATPSAQGLAESCVSSGPNLNPDACSLVYRNVAAVAGSSAAERSVAFRVGAPNGDPVGGFRQQPINYAKMETRGLDFTARYSFDSEEMIGRNWGRFDYSIGGLWLIQQDNFLSTANPNAYTPLASRPFYPRVRFTSRLAWSPNQDWTVTWVADWQTSQDIVNYRDFVNNPDSQPVEYLRTGNFVRNDLTVRWNVRDDLTLRAGVTNIFDAEQAPWLGTTLYSNFDPYGRRFNIGLNYRPW
ncbi:TonB-dependent receptor domain-containing protein [Brevundimonas sp. LPMIX5]|uniref:TonB-dependent receptor domain-containing protein n=1 Tax=Brevundimonas sp. LPMIX5 TaxID=2305887 RepID=UPI001314B643|nr:TonB-dependent receptor [Brevundimonas sp. LPMIX5]